MRQSSQVQNLHNTDLPQTIRQFSNNDLDLSLFDLFNFLSNQFLLIGFCVISGFAGNSESNSFPMQEVLMTCFASPVNKTGIFKVFNELAN